MTEQSSSRVRRALVWGIPAAAVLVAVGVGAVAYRSDEGGGSGGTAGSSVSRSSTIALDVDGSHLWLTSPDDDQVVEVDAETLEPTRRVEVFGQPQELTRIGDRVLVTGAQSDDLTVLDTTAAAPKPMAIGLPCGGSRGVVAIPEGVGGARHELAAVTCATDGLVVLVDLEARATLGTGSVPGRPTGIVRDGDRLTVSTAADGKLRTWRIEDLVAALPSDLPAAGEAPPVLKVAPVATRKVWVDGERSASTLAALDAGPRGPVGTYQVVDNARKLSTLELKRGNATYGTPIDGRARLEPAVAGPCGARFADFGDPARTLSGPVALAASPEQDLVWVVGQFSHSVSVVECDGVGGVGGRSTTVAAYDVGDGARGIVLDGEGTTAYVDVGFDHAVARLELPDPVASAANGDRPVASKRIAPDAVGKRETGTSFLSPLAQEGRRQFTDATDEHLTPFGVVTCASCHPSAGDDGLSWRIETKDAETGAIERKVRRTPAAWAIDAARKPLHWNGEFASTDDLVLDTVQDLLGGDGLLVDTAAISAYLAETPAPPLPPVETARQRAAVERGLAVFESAEAGCASCHAGPAGTDGKRHDVLPQATVPAARLAEVATPPLLGVRGRAPFGHDGRAVDLDALLAEHEGADGTVIELTPQQRRDVLAYLRMR